MILTSALQIRKYVYYSDLNFIILFVVILSLYAINLCAMSLFSGVFYQFERRNISVFVKNME